MWIRKSPYIVAAIAILFVGGVLLLAQPSIRLTSAGPDESGARETSGSNQGSNQRLR